MTTLRQTRQWAAHNNNGTLLIETHPDYPGIDRMSAAADLIADILHAMGPQAEETHARSWRTYMNDLAHGEY